MTQDVGKILEKAGALLEGHFLLTSGRHSPRYLEKFRLLQYPALTQRLCKMIAEHFRDSRADVVAGPTLGGIILAYEVARHLGVRSIYAEREDEGRAFRRGLLLQPGERALVVDDILTTGGSVRETIAAVEAAGAHLIGVGVEFGVPFFSCHRLSLPTYAPAECPQCAQGIPLTKQGGGAP